MGNATVDGFLGRSARSPWKCGLQSENTILVVDFNGFVFYTVNNNNPSVLRDICNDRNNDISFHNLLYGNYTLLDIYFYWTAKYLNAPQLYYYY